MTTSLRTSLISAISEDDALTPAQRAYFRRRLRSHMHEAIVNVFRDMKSKGLTKADLARRLDKAPEQITRWLATPGNLRLDTVSDLLLAMKHELVFSAQPISLAVKENEYHEMAQLTWNIANTGNNAVINIVNSSGFEWSNDTNVH